MPSQQAAPLCAALINSNCGMAFGYAIGIFAVINTFQEELTRCNKFTAKSACDGARTIGNCQWKSYDLLYAHQNTNSTNNNSGVCVYPDNATQKCAELNASDSCAEHKGCGWVKKPNKGDVHCQPTGQR